VFAPYWGRSGSGRPRVALRAPRAVLLRARAVALGRFATAPRRGAPSVRPDAGWAGVDSGNGVLPGRRWWGLEREWRWRSGRAVTRCGAASPTRVRSGAWAGCAGAVWLAPPLRRPAQDPSRSKMDPIVHHLRQHPDPAHRTAGVTSSNLSLFPSIGAQRDARGAEVPVGHERGMSWRPVHVR